MESWGNFRENKTSITSIWRLKYGGNEKKNEIVGTVFPMSVNSISMHSVKSPLPCITCCYFICKQNEFMRLCSCTAQGWPKIRLLFLTNDRLRNDSTHEYERYRESCLCAPVHLECSSAPWVPVERYKFPVDAPKIQNLIQQDFSISIFVQKFKWKYCVMSFFTYLGI